MGTDPKRVRDAVGDGVEFVQQDQLLGTADAVNRCAPYLKNYKGTVLVLCGDTPLLSKDIVAALLKQHHRSRASATVLTANIDNPQGYGRIVREGQVVSRPSVNRKMLLPLKIRLKRSMSVFIVLIQKDLFGILKKVKLNPGKKEFYLTDVIELLLADGKKVGTFTTQDETAAFGVNTREDLAQAQAIIRKQDLKQAYVIRGDGR